MKSTVGMLDGLYEEEESVDLEEGASVSATPASDTLVGICVEGGNATGARGKSIGDGLSEGILEAQKRPPLWFP